MSKALLASRKQPRTLETLNIPGDNLSSTEGGGRAMFETELQGVTGEDIDNFTEGRSERNWSIILAIYMRYPYAV